MPGDRIPCLVPFCKRTAAKSKYPEHADRPGFEIICGKCWVRADQWRRREYRRLRRRELKGVANARETELAHRLWASIKAQIMTREIA